MANIIASGSSALDSAEFTLTTDSATLYITGATGVCMATVRIKGADGTFSTIGELTNQYPAKLLSGAGTYKVTRAATGGSCAVDKN